MVPEVREPEVRGPNSFVHGNQIFWDHLPRETEWVGDCLSWGTNFLGLFVQGDRKWRTGSPGIKWVPDQLRRSQCTDYDQLIVWCHAAPVNYYLTLLLQVCCNLNSTMLYFHQRYFGLRKVHQEHLWYIGVKKFFALTSVGIQFTKWKLLDVCKKIFEKNKKHGLVFGQIEAMCSNSQDSLCCFSSLKHWMTTTT